jgi:cell division protein FtsQ
VRSGNLFSNRGSSVLDAPEPDRAQKNGGPQGLKRRAAVTEMPLRRDRSYVETFSSDYNSDIDREFTGRAQRPGVRLSFRGGLIPKSVWGKIAAGGALLVIASAVVGGMMWARSFLLSDEHFTVPNSASIQIAGNSHLTRAQLLSVFGGDVDRNIFRIPLEQRRAELERLPWVGHATVMRLLPNRIRVGIVERTPVAFVRNGTQIGLVDGNGVLFDLPDAQPDEAGHTFPEPHYSFPVLTGISLSDPLSTRAARMKLYMAFLTELDTGGEAVSKKVSEVDLSNPDDVRAIVPDANSQASNVLIHFGADRFLDRYREYQEHLAEWRTQCPRLASVDMRYDQQVVLDPCPPAADAGVSAAATSATAKSPAPETRSTHAVAAAVRPKAVAPRKNTVRAKPKPAHAGLHGAAR